ncbi:hypothetical protein CBR_g66797 [Chara braunii]|uniref:PDZ domain-containing protein n=1 Tax=Chara braunii TaxID=69332 RepID=A0A388K9C2_CHABU|nr:hypothetical protein CBR_g66797 [Chara braunii]|eukprot:GBG66662.1 hypothetical protein CBR_g66797 [Chara braunii]
MAVRAVVGTAMAAGGATAATVAVATSRAAGASSSSSSSSSLALTPAALHHGCHVASRSSLTIRRSTLFGVMESEWQAGSAAKGMAAGHRQPSTTTTGFARSGTPGTAMAALKEDEYEIEVEKPIGLKFYKGADGGTYVDAIAPSGNADKTGMVEVGDKVLETSATFGTDMWPAAEYGRTMYALRTRIGTIALKMQKKYGKREGVAVAADKFQEERRSGNYEAGTREIQYRNYMKKQEERQLRKTELNKGLQLYKARKYEEALLSFGTVLGLNPEPTEEGVANYNVACCYSKLNQIDQALNALDGAMAAGFEDYKMVRTDPDLEAVRKSEKFAPLINRYDEPFINENAVAAIKGLFGMFGNK